MEKKDEVITVKRKDVARLLYLFSCLLIIVSGSFYYLGQVTTAMPYGIQLDLLKEQLKSLETDREKENRINTLQQISIIIRIFDQLDNKHIYYISTNETHGTVYMASGDWTTGQNGSWIPIAYLKWNGERWILMEMPKNKEA
ncbi:MAG: hypothetical protein ACTSQ8_25475 [Candidatus Helarchaeota archaeon]